MSFKYSDVHIDTPSSATIAQDPDQRARVFMIVSNISCPPMNGNVQTHVHLLQKYYPDRNLVRWDGCVHHDTPTRHHVTTLAFKNPHKVKSIAKSLHISVNQILIYHGNVNNALMYPFHATRSARLTKTQYDVSEGFANFDVRALYNRVTEHVKKHDNEYLRMIDQYITEQMSLDELAEKIGIVAYVKYSNKIEYAHQQVRNHDHRVFNRKHKNIPVRITILGGDNSDTDSNCNYSTGAKLLILRDLLNKKPQFYVDPRLSYFFGYDGQANIVTNYDDFLNANKNNRMYEFDAILKRLFYAPAQHDLYVTNKRDRVPLNCEHLYLVCSNKYPVELDLFTGARNMTVLKNNRDYEKFIQKNGLSANLIR